MKDELTKQDINTIVLIGKKSINELVDVLELINGFRNKEFINHQHWDTWYKKIDDLTDEDLIFLFKGLVHIDRVIDWGGGSVSAGIWIYRKIQQKGLDKDMKIADYGLNNCANPYIPFGMVTDAKSSKEFYLGLMMKAAKAEAGLEKERKMRQRAEGRKIKRKKAMAELRKLDYETRGQIHKELKEKYSQSSVKEKLELVGADEKYPPEYYPTEWALITEQEVKNLPVDLIKKLYDKLSSKTKGPWRKFSLTLLKYDDGF